MKRVRDLSIVSQNQFFCQRVFFKFSNNVQAPNWTGKKYGRKYVLFNSSTVISLWPIKDSNQLHPSPFFLFLYLFRYVHAISFQATRSDRIYVNSPDAPKGDDGNIQILSFTQSAKTEERGRENLGMNQDEVHEDAEDDEETLTPGDLLAFAWQISEGMVRHWFVWINSATIWCLPCARN